MPSHFVAVRRLWFAVLPAILFLSFAIYLVAAKVFASERGYQWVLFIGAHSQRHTLQIYEVKASPNFPKR